MPLFDTRRALTREKRSGALSHYHGTLVSILEDSSGTEIPQRVRTLSQSSPGEVLYALNAVSGITGSAAVIHGGIGCSASSFALGKNSSYNFYTTNLNESDTILGGDEKLRTAVVRAYKENHPSVIFIIGTPINAINNDDVDSVILELEDELGCKIIYIDVNGFRTKNALSGYDQVYHSFLKYLVEPVQDANTRFINLISLSENPENVFVIAELLKRLDIPCNIIPHFSGIRGIQKASGALFSISLDDGENEYFLQGLEENFSVPWIKTNPPIGSAQTSDFIRKIAQVFGSGEKAEKLIAEEEKGIAASIGNKPLGGKKVFLNMDLHRAVSFAALVEEFGGEVLGLAVPHLDKGNEFLLKELSGLPRTLPFIIAKGQQFELANALSKHPADFYIGDSDSSATAARFGAQALSLDSISYYGYSGLEKLSSELQKISAAGIFPVGISPTEDGKTASLYSESWLKRSGNWYVKVEVK
ncbi:nitrogenase component 1 [Leadbettera azotonutricia]|uniref:Putative oxidoreductase/nitrogenase, component 1 n=1 Tax=Leadbettera azotonutricia (strain ATCC BAA-888 / DSM 13862 / ZAS-9) TaxID=545695 RepID=F5YCN3_LEAAZ|nr:nitrogenase component 1 [Leadbettera azotonutricia]AEF81934.1 putative oxidoreductase/nitrogenase, component 1 [Leadbettera azotonutricia ZAS-9]